MTQPLRNVGRPKNLYIEAMRSIKDSIFRGDYSPGESLPSEKDLAIILGISRPVLREALRALQGQGFLDVRRGSRGGTYITDLNNISINDNLPDLLRIGKLSMADFTQARLLLEPEVFRLATRHASNEQLNEMENLVQQAEITKDLKQKIQLESDFHRMVAAASGSQIYIRFMQTIFDFIEVFAVNIQPEDFQVHDQNDHEEIFAAMKLRDEDLVATLTKKHAEKVTKTMIKMEKQWLKNLESQS